MEAKAVDFVQYTVSDLDTAVPFYRDTLGLTLEDRLDEHGWAEFAMPPTTLALNEPGPQDPSTPGGGSASVALAVDDVEEAVADLREEDVAVLTEPFETGVCEIAIVADPDGNPIVLHRRDDGTHGRVDPFP
ncbi:VOC family protein [Halapricum hydrolyticum]|uniref:VOC family protein n=1 Tax=Halapricum hydrolyticum TaxID=2979991 RepID=A0AAE3I9X4_9EURY|nr:VOC family protein [Halapricum hydrolyticum]MCU4717434.1 VOC family protein [Halapricum hydrolyticum]MCU4726598.1 VOC family protein [Halapricum hydrolyticum]